ncbi:hypothetical protein K503DRAFT_777860 [Rhizopogon vinicolor AM-OR11-026]|uniref:DUF6534 domain-containing protein n=1 Tax=Rhizopogon vinicolor AM-OR11-026 TaxID=1314800 RepID=A0A1B7MEM6_9AGAM|nr:hypothetical protein K503DRAFT_777860 [Rhizopogon vinicolor AM-OR11-026]
MADSPAPCALTGANVDTSGYGGLLGGLLFAFMFYGVNCLQVFFYLVTYPKDRMILKAMVAVIWACDTAHQVLGTIGIWQYLVLNYGNYTYLEGTRGTLFVSILFTVIVSTTAQLFLTYRIWHLSGRIWIFPAVLVPAAVAQLVVACIYVFKGLIDLTIENLYVLDGYPTALNALAAATDVIIAIITCTLLARGRRGFNKRTDAMLARLIIISVNSGLWTGVFAVVTAVVSLQNSLLFTWPWFSMCSLYCNTILGCLNARGFIHNGMHRDEDSDTTFHLSTRPISQAGGAQRPISSSIAVQIKQTNQIDTDNLDGLCKPRLI